MSFAWWPHTTDERVASYRLRCGQIVVALARRGCEVRLWNEATGAAPRVLVLSKRYDAASMATAVNMRSRRGTRVVLDLCDNHFFHDDANDQRWAAHRAANLRAAVAACDGVVVATQALAQVVRNECPSVQHIDVIGDAVEDPTAPTASLRLGHAMANWRLRRLGRALHTQPNAKRLVWFGNHGSSHAKGGMLDLLSLRDTLDHHHRKSPLQLSVISNDAAKYRTLTRDWAVATHYLPWHAHTFSRALKLHEVCVIPIGLNPFTRCKTNNRVATALMHGLAVAADPIDSYLEFADSTVLGDWGGGFERLLNDTAHRHALIERGRQHLADHWTLSNIASQWLHMLERTAAQRLAD